MKKQVILVLGMHRSGTSVVTRLLSLMGAGLPKTLLGQNEGNQRGHWESRLIIEHHDNVLEELESNWMDYRPLRLNRITQKRRNSYMSDMADLFKSEHSDQNLSVVKEPRICRFTALYIKALEKALIAPFCVLVIRNPLEVAASITKRDGLITQHGLLLWLSHMLITERESRNQKRHCLIFDKVLKNPTHEMQALQDALDIDFPYPVKDVVDEIEAFITPNLKRNSIETEALDLNVMTQGWVSQCYQALLVLCKNPHSESAINKLDKIWAEYQQAAPLLYANQLDFQKRLSERDETIAGRDLEITSLKTQHEKAWVEANIQSQKTDANHFIERDKLQKDHLIEIQRLESAHKSAWEEAKVETKKAVSALSNERDELIKTHKSEMARLENQHEKAWEEAEAKTKTTVSALINERDEVIKTHKIEMVRLENQHKKAWEEAEAETKKTVSALIIEKEELIDGHKNEILRIENDHKKAWDIAQKDTQRAIVRLSEDSEAKLQAAYHEHNVSKLAYEKAVAEEVEKRHALLAKTTEEKAVLISQNKTQIEHLLKGLHGNMETLKSKHKEDLKEKTRDYDMVLSERDFMQNQFDIIFSETNQSLQRAQNDLKQQQRAYEHELEVRLNKILMLKNEIHALRTSRIWRMTSGLRSVVNAFKGQSSSKNIEGPEEALRLTFDEKNKPH